jgi:integrase
MVSKRGKYYYLRIRPFGGKEIGLKTRARSKTEARQIEMAVMTACRSGDYRLLDPISREICLRMFQNRGWEVPADLSMSGPVQENLTLWKAVQLGLTYPEMRNHPNRERYEHAFVHLLEHWGKDFPVKSIWIPQVKEYQLERQKNGAAASTINKEKSALSRMFQVLMELRHLDVNPARMVKNLSEKSGERQVYLSHSDFQAMVTYMPKWLRPVAETAYYTGMRQGEILGLTRKHVNLASRIILLGPEDVKESHWKRVPIHIDLVPILEEAMKVQSISCDQVFLVRTKPPSRHSIRKPWNKAVDKVGLSPMPTFHDLRHTWKTNARRSGMDPEIRESIMGHWYRARNVTERYGRISDDELLSAVDSMRFEWRERRDSNSRPPA